MHFAADKHYQQILHYTKNKKTEFVRYDFLNSYTALQQRGCRDYLKIIRRQHAQ